ncbi:MAG TPA: glycosyltransferase family 39 protein, partial [Bryobacteraceae bacterium]|nr:glycosyltransferase family 39 protein [Bryobacteraceae bacterium]
FAIHIRHVRIPIMHMSYVGALKTWIYAPIALFWQPSAAMLRVPALVIGALTVALFWNLLSAVHSRRAAWAGCLLLITDAVFLLTTVFDWGPVAIQHLLLVAMLLASVQWARSGRDRWLFAAAVCCGLAFWDKAVFIWMFSGLVAGSLLFWRSIRDRFTWKRAAIVTAGVVLGGAPLIWYNFSTTPRFLTFRSNTHFTPGRFAERFPLLRLTWNGTALFGYMVYDAADRPNEPRTVLERASFALHKLTGDRNSDEFEPALILSFLLIPLLWKTRARTPLLFAAIAGAVAWCAMVSLDGGGGVHHTVLLWPLPQMLVALAFAEASMHWRFGGWALATAVAFLAIANLIVMNQYLYQFIRNGSAGSWTDAIYPLAEALRKTPASRTALVDWGYQDPLSYLNRATPPERVIVNPFMPADEPAAEREADRELLLDPNVIWVEHVPGREAFAGVNARVASVAREAGLDPVVAGTFCDRNGRPIFQILRFVPQR